MYSKYECAQPQNRQLERKIYTYSCISIQLQSQQRSQIVATRKREETDDDNDY